MAAIYLIRHGQASFGSNDYDQLSEKGSQQAAILGQYWRARPEPSKFFCGDLLRHGQTLTGFMKGYQGETTPTVIHSGFNEFDHVDILQKYNAQWHNFAKMNESLNQLSDPNKALQKEFLQALNRWISGTHDQDYKESWVQFKARCIRALQNVIEQELAKKRQPSRDSQTSKSKDILVFTSGGTISVIVQHILQLSDQQTLALNQQARNTGVTKLLFSENMLSIDYFNNYSHLEQVGEEWVTFK
ncbi:histidine phosphatase family protein [Shewanella inventionis]|uniref:Histidine phosphatase family protein n=1 Tax=Shewanella inventionis TaxID=1738770 RepID=A0ABQ1JGD9_9GAMM|nr:histidine phosphatase family protein [Shewanella inventionis]MCL1158371.1 histidine phosphatase family protein [Shewanella inventionis]UAL41727.1 histidine phosphatase family protein [Shewanella inventionis]GGB68277.1 histidine phosphatase family protein [Shewanella inventionis]